MLTSTHRPDLDPGLIAVAALLLAWVPVYLSGRRRWRLPFLILVVGVLGLWLNAPLTEVDLVNLALGHAAAPWESPLRWLLIGFVVVATFAFGQVWCGWLCPFGAMQELIGRVGGWLGLGAEVDQRLERRLRALKFVLLASMLIMVFITAEAGWAAWDPMQSVFAGRWSWPMGLMILAVLAASLWWVRPWCRYLCPLGAFLALGNRLALLQRRAPARRFGHCDLGVRGGGDLDCIRCNRCIGPQPRGSAPARTAGGAALTALLVAVLVLIGAHLSQTLSAPTGQGRSWRDLDLELLRRRIDAGELREHEADWYHPARAGEGP